MFFFFYLSGINHFSHLPQPPLWLLNWMPSTADHDDGDDKEIQAAELMLLLSPKGSSFPATLTSLTCYT
jgi:hypothetical protein